MQLPESLDVNAAEQLKADFLARRGAPLALDASRVERLGGLCLQVILSAAATWADDGQAFSIADVSPSFEDSARAMGAWDAPAQGA